jgi:hypothetical protein
MFIIFDQRREKTISTNTQDSLQRLPVQASFHQVSIITSSIHMESIRWASWKRSSTKLNFITLSISSTSAHSSSTLIFISELPEQVKLFLLQVDEQQDPAAPFSDSKSQVSPTVVCTIPSPQAHLPLLTQVPAEHLSTE